MSTVELILSATDGSENARRCVQRADAIGEHRGAQGILLRVSSHGRMSRSTFAWQRVKIIESDAGTTFL